MARQTKVASKYAKAILDFQGDQSKSGKLVEECKALADLVNGHEELSLVFNSQVFSKTQRDAVMEELEGKLGFSDDFKKILKVLSRSKRLDYLREIAEELQDQILQDKGVVSVKIESANELDSDEKGLIEKKFHGLLGKDIEANYVVDPDLIGGLKVTAAGRTYNGTLAGWFDSFEEKLVGG